MKLPKVVEDAVILERYHCRNLGRTAIETQERVLSAAISAYDREIEPLVVNLRTAIGLNCGCEVCDAARALLAKYESMKEGKE